MPPSSRLFLLFLATWVAGLGALAAQNVRTIGIVSDGPSWYFDNFAEKALRELRDLAGDDYEVKVKEFNAERDNQRVTQLLLDAIADPAVDVIYASGAVATERAASLTPQQRSKPILGGALQFSEVRIEGISERGSSTVPNFTFITNPQRVVADVELMQMITGGTKQLHALIEARILPELTGLDKALVRFEKEFGVNITIVPSWPTAAQTLGNVPSGVKVMYVAINPDMLPAEREKLFDGLAKRGIPTVCMSGPSDLELGGLACLAPANEDVVARRVALNLFQLLAGVDAQILPVYLPVQDQLVINAAAAVKTGWSPTYDIALSALVIHEDALYQGEPISLEESMRRAASQNAGVKIEREDQEIAIQDKKSARSLLLPQLSVDASHARVDFDDRINPILTPEYVRDGEYGVELRQILFNDEVLSSVKAAELNIFAEDFDALSEELDAQEDAALAYFDYLTAEALYDIEKENLRLVENNLQLAKLRIDIGAAEPSEVYRWEQDVASGRATLFQRDSTRKNALIEFNRILGAPREKIWDVQDIELESDDFYFLGEQLRPMIQNKREFTRFGQFLQLMAVENSPELAAFDYGLAAQGILLNQRQRRFFLPEVSGFAGYDRALEGTNRTDTNSQNETTVGVQFSYPIFEGGGRKAEVARQKAVIRQLAAQREDALQRIEQRVLAAVNGIASEHPNIRLSRRALKASEQTYESVQEKYSQGAATILDLLDAQSALLRQRQQEAVAVYSYLQQVHSLQRSIAWFEFTKTPTEKQIWIAALDSYMATSDTDALELAVTNYSELAHLKAKIAVDKSTSPPDPQPVQVAAPTETLAESEKAVAVETAEDSDNRRGPFPFLRKGSSPRR